jgi:hypothetical protein
LAAVIAAIPQGEQSRIMTALETFSTAIKTACAQAFNGQDADRR